MGFEVITTLNKNVTWLEPATMCSSFLSFFLARDEVHYHAHLERLALNAPTRRKLNTGFVVIPAALKGATNTEAPTAGSDHDLAMARGTTIAARFMIPMASKVYPLALSAWEETGFSPFIFRALYIPVSILWDRLTYFPCDRTQIFPSIPELTQMSIHTLGVLAAEALFAEVLQRLGVTDLLCRAYSATSNGIANFVDYTCEDDHGAFRLDLIALQADDDAKMLVEEKEAQEAENKALAETALIEAAAPVAPNSNAILDSALRKNAADLILAGSTMSTTLSADVDVEEEDFHVVESEAEEETGAPPVTETTIPEELLNGGVEAANTTDEVRELTNLDKLRKNSIPPVGVPLEEWVPEGFSWMQRRRRQMAITLRIVAEVASAKSTVRRSLRASFEKSSAPSSHWYAKSVATTFYHRISMSGVSIMKGGVPDYSSPFPEPLPHLKSFRDLGETLSRDVGITRLINPTSSMASAAFM